MDEAAHGVDVHVAVSGVVLDVRRVGEQHQLHPHATFGPPASELLDILAFQDRRLYAGSFNRKVGKFRSRH